MIRPQFLNLLNSSFLLWLDHYILEKGGGFITGITSNYYPIGQIYYSGTNLYTYASPYQPQVTDYSITPKLMTGCYLSGSFINVGSSGLISIDYKSNRLFFDRNIGNSTKVSGVFSLNEVNIMSLTVAEDKILFETKMNLRNKTNITPTGIPNDSVTYPAIYVKDSDMSNKPYALGGLDKTTVNIGAFLFMETQYQLDTLKSILNDAKNEIFPLLTPDKNPYNALGGFKDNQIYNYNTLKTGYIAAGSGVYIDDVSVTTFGKGLGRTVYSELMALNPDVFWSVVDFDICRIRLPRSNANNL